MGKTHHRVSIIIPAWNNWELSCKCLQSLHEHTHGISFEVILVDNGSTDKTPHDGPLLGQALFGDSFTYAQLPDNMGFAKACNHGASESRGKLLLFLNNDTTVTSGWLPPLVEALKGQPRLGGVGPLLVFPDETFRAQSVQHLGIAVHYGPNFQHLYEMFPASHPVVQRQRKLSAITAAAFLIPATLYAAHGGFHEGYVNGMEDMDLCSRIAGQGGYFTVVPESVVQHHTNCTPGRFDMETENQCLLEQRCRSVEETCCRLHAEDGFESAFTPWLTLVPKLPEERVRALDAEYGGVRDLDQLHALIQQEPLWDTGYISIIRESLTADNPVFATMMSHLRTLLCPSFIAFRNHLEFMRLFGNDALAQEFGNKVARIDAALADKTALVQKARAIEMKTRDPLTVAALEVWRKQNAPE
nr:glycosyltransferase [uncultured Pseudodesulfovibrio sp.]